MINFIQEYWWQIVLYLIGCILAWGRINAIQEHDGLQDMKVYRIVVTLCSWAGFITALMLGGSVTKWFKWLPILLLWCMVGCNDLPRNEANIQMTTIDQNDVREITIDGCQYIYISWGYGTWGSHKGNCNNPIHMPIQPIDTTHR